VTTRLGRLATLGLVVVACGCATTTTLGTAPPPEATAEAPPTSSATPAPTYPANVLDRPDFSPLEPADYYIEPEALPLRVLFSVPADGWVSWIGTFKTEQTEGREHRYVAMSIANVTNLVVHGCTDHSAADPSIGPTVDDLANALADLPPFLVTTPPMDVAIYGYSGKYLQLTVPDLPLTVAGGESYFSDCRDQELYEANWSPDSPPEDIAELRAVLESIRIER
jgi:hypothetical protein